MATNRSAFRRLAVAAFAVLLLLSVPLLNSSASVTFSQTALSAAVVPLVPFAGAGRYGLATGSGIQYLAPADQNRELDAVRATGMRWIRLDLKWNEVQTGGPADYDWNRYDTVIHAAQSRGLTVLADIVGAPPWARNPACASSGDTCAPSNPALFGTFANRSAAHYAPSGVHAWELWNEPNITTFWKPAPNPVSYTALLQAGYRGVKTADAAATVVSGGLASVATTATTLTSTTFLRGMYSSGAHGYFDALGDHPYCWAQPVCPNAPTAPDSGSGWSTMSDNSDSLRRLMIANGDTGKRIWATEFGAPTGGGGKAGTEAHQAQMLTQAYQLFSSYPWSGPLFWYTYQDAGAVGAPTEAWFGLVRADGSRKPAYAALVTSVAAAVSRDPGNAAVTVHATVAASTPTLTAEFKVCARDSSGGNRDYFPAQNNVSIATGRQFTATAVFPRGSYTYFACVKQANGAWWNGAVARFTVAG